MLTTMFAPEGYTLLKALSAGSFFLMMYGLTGLFKNLVTERKSHRNKQQA
ncbi:hypothetical protein [Duffyella gerundensis]|nr:hypothetical protein [Duffyella gerundensis]